MDTNQLNTTLADVENELLTGIIEMDDDEGRDAQDRPGDETT